MTDTVIYVSITRGNATLTLDGNFYLFGELLTTLHDAARDLYQSNPVTSLPTENPKQNEEGNNAAQ